MNDMKINALLASTASFLLVMSPTLAQAQTTPNSLQTSNAITKVNIQTFHFLDELGQWANKNQINVIVRDESG